MRPRRPGWPANRAASTRIVAVRAAKQGSALRSWIIPGTVVAAVVPVVPGGYPGLGSVGKIPATIRVTPNTPVRIGAATEPQQPGADEVGDLHPAAAAQAQLAAEVVQRVISGPD